MDVYLINTKEGSSNHIGCKQEHLGSRVMPDNGSTEPDTDLLYVHRVLSYNRINFLKGVPENMKLSLPVQVFS